MGYLTTILGTCSHLIGDLRLILSTNVGFKSTSNGFSGEDWLNILLKC